MSRPPLEKVPGQYLPMDRMKAREMCWWGKSIGTGAKNTYTKHVSQFTSVGPVDGLFEGDDEGEPDG